MLTRAGAFAGEHYGVVAVVIVLTDNVVVGRIIFFHAARYAEFNLANALDNVGLIAFEFDAERAWLLNFDFYKRAVLRIDAAAGIGDAHAIETLRRFQIREEVVAVVRRVSAVRRAVEEVDFIRSRTARDVHRDAARSIVDARRDVCRRSGQMQRSAWLTDGVGTEIFLARARRDVQYIIACRQTAEFVACAEHFRRAGDVVFRVGFVPRVADHFAFVAFHQRDDYRAVVVAGYLRRVGIVAVGDNVVVRVDVAGPAADVGDNYARGLDFNRYRYRLLGLTTVGVGESHFVGAAFLQVLGVARMQSDLSAAIAQRHHFVFRHLRHLRSAGPREFIRFHAAKWCRAVVGLFAVGGANEDCAVVVIAVDGVGTVEAEGQFRSRRHHQFVVVAGD